MERLAVVSLANSYPMSSIHLARCNRTLIADRAADASKRITPHRQREAMYATAMIKMKGQRSAMSTVAIVAVSWRKCFLSIMNTPWLIHTDVHM
jgi:hypothetical protein